MDLEKRQKTHGEGVVKLLPSWGQISRWHGQERLGQVVKSEMKQELKGLSEKQKVGEVKESNKDS